MVTIVQQPAPDVDQVEQLDPDTAAGFAALEAEAAGLEGGGAAPGAPGAGPAPLSQNAPELLGALTMVRMMAAPMFRDLPDFPQVWSDQTLQAIAESGGAIMDMHGWNMAELFGRWGPYIALVAATAPPAMVTMVHLKKKRAYLAEMARRRAAGEGGPAPMPKAAAADGVTGDA